MPIEPNLYSRQWFEFFHFEIDEERTTKEVEFVCRCAPLPEFQKILDVCCGMGRHARALSDRGYSVTGIDRDRDAIAKARELGEEANYVVADIRNYRPAPEGFDATIVMGQSFGHFDAATNCEILRRLAGATRKGGRIILDLWNPEFFEAHQGERELKISRGIVREKKRVDKDRLLVRLDYPDGAHEQFEWQLFTARQMGRLADSIGLTLLTLGSGFDLMNLPSPVDPRIEFVLERRK
jgi:SAM-dependent methyltransferase